MEVSGHYITCAGWEEEKRKKRRPFSGRQSGFTIPVLLLPLAHSFASTEKEELPLFLHDDGRTRLIGNLDYGESFLKKKKNQT